MRPPAAALLALLLLLLAASAASAAAVPEKEPRFVNAVAAPAPSAPAAPAARAPDPPAPAETNTNTATFDVIVIGAGISGIAAALQLTTANNSNNNNTASIARPLRVLVLEGRDRAGGRLATSAEVPQIDAGAMWVHNARAPNNPLPALAKKHGLKMSPLQDYNSGAIFASDGARAPFLPLATAAASWQRSFTPALRAVKQRNSTADDESIWDVYEQWTQPFEKNGSANNNNNNNNNNTNINSTATNAAVLAAARLRLASNVEILLNADARNLSAARFGDSKVIPADDVVLEQGFGALVAALLASADPPLDMLYGEAVEAIEQQDDGGGAQVVTVRTRGNSGSNDDTRSWRARRVIVTVPLGVLKASIPGGGLSSSSSSSPSSVVSTAAWGAERIPANAPGPIAFSPPLPDAKVRAIRDFGFGRLEKVILDYGRGGDDEDAMARSSSSSNLTSLEVRRAPPGSAASTPPKSVFWDASSDFISREPPVEVAANVNNSNGNSDTSFPPFAVFLNYYKSLGRPVLVALNAGSSAKRAAAFGYPDAVVAAADAVLDSLYPPGGTADAKKATRPPPSRYDVTDWAGDPFSRGSYSYFAVGNARGIASEIARPFGLVHFAGEHTSADAPATVHGALLSGELEARRVLEALGAVV